LFIQRSARNWAHQRFGATLDKKVLKFYLERRHSKPVFNRMRAISHGLGSINNI
jgi:hypothetical protein